MIPASSGGHVHSSGTGSSTGGGLEPWIIIRRLLRRRDFAKLFRRRRIHPANRLQRPNDEFDVFVHALGKVGGRDHDFVFAVFRFEQACDSASAAQCRAPWPHSGGLAADQ
jgi:hypothetical protein